MRDKANMRQGLIDLCAVLKRKGIKSLVEVGSYAGESVALFRQHVPKAEIFCIDPWLPGYDANDATSEADMVSVEKQFDAQIAGLPGITKLKGVSTDFATHPKLQKVDAVYIDGCHTYEAVKADIAFWLPRCTAIICGHDWNKRSWPGVCQAITEAFGKPHRTFADTSWLVHLTKSNDIST